MTVRVFSETGTTIRARRQWEDILLNIYTPTRPIYIASGGTGGNGSRSTPFKVNNAGELDAILRGLFIEDPPNPPAVIFKNGLYRTNGARGVLGLYGNTGWAARSHWNIYGESEDGVVIQRSGPLDYSYATEDALLHGRSTLIGPSGTGLTGVEVCNLTLDCQWSQLSVEATESWVQPEGGGSVMVMAGDTAQLRIGKHAYAYDPNTHEKKGNYLCVAKTSTTATLRRIVNIPEQPGSGAFWDGPDAGELIPEGTRIAPTVNTRGLAFNGFESLAENVTVTNTGTPRYEGTLGIEIGAQSGERETTPGNRNLIRYCTVRDTYGSHGCGIGLTGNGAGDNGQSVSVIIENCNLDGGGHGAQGVGWFAVSNTRMAGNVIRGFKAGFFNDTFWNRNISIIGNEVHDAYWAVHLNPGGIADRHTVTRNRFILPQASFAFFLTHNIRNCVFQNNLITLKPGATSATDFQFFFNHSGCGGNTFGNTLGTGVLGAEIPSEFMA